MWFLKVGWSDVNLFRFVFEVEVDVLVFGVEGILVFFIEGFVCMWCFYIFCVVVGDLGFLGSVVLCGLL